VFKENIPRIYLAYLDCPTQSFQWETTISEAVRSNGKKGHKTRGMPTDFQKNFSLLIGYSFPCRNERHSIPIGRAKYVLKLFLKPQVSLDLTDFL